MPWFFKKWYTTFKIIIHNRKNLGALKFSSMLYNVQYDSWWKGIVNL
jgi:hypothetical protein